MVAYDSAVGGKNGQKSEGQRDSREDRGERAHIERERERPASQIFPASPAEGEQRGHPDELNMSAKRKATAIMQHHKVSLRLRITRVYT